MKAAAALRPPAGWQLVDRCFAVAGPQLADPARCGELRTSAVRIDAWLRAGCDFEADVLPTIQAITHRPRPGKQPIRDFSFFEAAVLEARDRRLAPARPFDPSLTQERPHDAPANPERAAGPASIPSLSGSAPIGIAAHVANAQAVRRRGALAALRELGELEAGSDPAAPGDQRSLGG